MNLPHILRDVIIDVNWFGCITTMIPDKSSIGKRMHPDFYSPWKTSPKWKAQSISIRRPIMSLRVQLIFVIETLHFTIKIDKSQFMIVNLMIEVRFLKVAIYVITC
jgi:hypothetical protein